MNGTLPHVLRDSLDDDGHILLCGYVVAQSVPTTRIVHTYHAERDQAVQQATTSTEY